MRSEILASACSLVAMAIAGCGDPESTGTTSSSSSSSSSSSGAGGQGGAPSYDWGLPPGYPKPSVPASNPMSKEKVELGRHLFYDKRLSDNQSYACATCHQQSKAFTDGRAQAIGSTGQLHPRGAQSTVNVGYLTALTWANPVIPSLEEQALVPLFGETPVELGLAGKEKELLDRLSSDPTYVGLFDDAFPEGGVISLEHVTMAIASFERAILSYRSPYDRYAYGGDPTALSDAAKRGRDLFFGEKLECFHCHGGFNFSDSVTHDGSAIKEVMFHNTGLYNLGGTGAYPPDNQGIYAFSHVDSDMGRFRAPTLRNIAVTAPYMHDGSIADLDGVLDHYAAGGRTITTGPYAGVGSANPYKSELIRGFALTPEERGDVKAFLASLTDDALREDPALADPWGSP